MTIEETIADLIIISIYVTFNWIIYKLDKKHRFRIWFEVSLRFILPVLIAFGWFYLMGSYWIFLIILTGLALLYIFNYSEFYLMDRFSNAGNKLVILNFTKCEPIYNELNVYFDSSQKTIRVKTIIQENIRKYRIRIDDLLKIDGLEEKSSSKKDKKPKKFIIPKEITDLRKEIKEMVKNIRIESKVKGKKGKEDESYKKLTTEMKIELIDKKTELLQSNIEDFIKKYEKELKKKERELSQKDIDRIEAELERKELSERLELELKELEEYQKLIDSMKDFYLHIVYLNLNDFVNDDYVKYCQLYILRERFEIKDINREENGVLEDIRGDESLEKVIPKVLNLNCVLLENEEIENKKYNVILGIEGYRDEKLLIEFFKLKYALENVKIIPKFYEIEALENQVIVYKQIIDDLRSKMKKLKDFKQTINTDLEKIDRGLK